MEEYESATIEARCAFSLPAAMNILAHACFVDSSVVLSFCAQTHSTGPSFAVPEFHTCLIEGTQFSSLHLYFFHWLFADANSLALWVFSPFACALISRGLYRCCCCVFPLYICLQFEALVVFPLLIVGGYSLRLLFP